MANLLRRISSSHLRDFSGPLSYLRPDSKSSCNQNYRSRIRKQIILATGFW